MKAEHVVELGAQLEAHPEADVKLIDEDGQAFDVDDVRFDGDNTIIIEISK